MRMARRDSYQTVIPTGGPRLLRAGAEGSAFPSSAILSVLCVFALSLSLSDY